MSSTSNGYFFFDELSKTELFELVNQPKTLLYKPTYRLQVHHKRLKTFTKHGCVCHACGRKGTKLVAECHVGPNFLKWYFNPLDNPLPIAHVNLYGYDKDGTKFMMTSDHRVPRSLGGSDGVGNRVPLCETCNGLKGNDPDWLQDLPRNTKGRLIHRKNRQIKTKKQDARPERYYA